MPHDVKHSVMDAPGRLPEDTSIPKGIRWKLTA